MWLVSPGSVVSLMPGWLRRVIDLTGTTAPTEPAVPHSIPAAICTVACPAHPNRSFVELKFWAKCPNSEVLLLCRCFAETWKNRNMCRKRSGRHPAREAGFTKVTSSRIQTKACRESGWPVLICSVTLGSLAGHPNKLKDVIRPVVWWRSQPRSIHPPGCAQSPGSTAPLPT